MAFSPGVFEKSLPHRKRFGRSVFWKQRMMGYAFIAPTIIMFLTFTVLPLGLSFFYAFTDYNLIFATKFLGFNNFKSAFLDKDFMMSFVNVAVYAVMVIPMSIASSFGAAVLVNTKLKGTKIYRSLYYIPAVTSGVAVAYIWSWLYNEKDGIFSGILGLFGLPEVAWIDSPSYIVMFSIALMQTWVSLGGNMLIFLAALKGISPELYEAAAVDGASGPQKLFRITLPMIAPTMYFMLTMSVIGAFQLFDPVYIMIPQTSALDYARTPIYMIYSKGFDNRQAGYGTAMSLILFAVIMVVTFVTQRFVKEDRTV